MLVPTLKLVSGSTVIDCYGTFTTNRTPGQFLVRLVDGSLARGNSWKKKTLSVDIQTIAQADLDALLVRSHRTWTATRDSQSVGIRISGEINYQERRRFPGYYSVSFNGEEI